MYVAQSTVWTRPVAGSAVVFFLGFELLLILMWAGLR